MPGRSVTGFLVYFGPCRTLAHSLSGYYRRQLRDPTTVMMLSHQLLTLVHFITWASAYGGIEGSGPSDTRVKEFDDIVISIMGLAGWCSMLYFTRGCQVCYH